VTVSVSRRTLFHDGSWLVVEWIRLAHDRDQPGRFELTILSTVHMLYKYDPCHICGFEVLV